MRAARIARHGGGLAWTEMFPSKSGPARAGLIATVQVLGRLDESQGAGQATARRRAGDAPVVGAPRGTDRVEVRFIGWGP